MAGRRERHGDAWRHLDRRVVSDRLQLRQRAVRVGLAVQRQRRLMLRVAVLVGLRASSSWMRPSRAARGRHRSAVPAVQNTLPLEPVRTQPRQVADVIEVRVRQDDRIDGVGRHGKRLPVPQPELLQSLEESAVDEHAAAAMFEQVFRAGDRARGAEKRQLSHAATISGVLPILSPMAGEPFRPLGVPLPGARRHSPSARRPRRRARELTIDAIYDPESARGFQRRAAHEPALDRRDELPADAARGARRRVARRRRGIRTDVAAVRRGAHGRRACRAAGHDAREAADSARSEDLTFNPSRTAALVTIDDDLYFYDFSAGRARAADVGGGRRGRGDVQPERPRRRVRARQQPLHVVDVARPAGARADDRWLVVSPERQA